MIQIGVISDTHGEFRLVSQAVSIMESLDIQTVLHCGDVGGTEIVKLFAPFHAFFVRGNTDEAVSLERTVKQEGQTWCGAFGGIELEQVKIGFTHGDSTTLLKNEAKSGRWNLICYGHTHVQDYSIEYNGTRLLNPGAFRRVSTASFATVTVDGDKISIQHIAVHG